MSIFNTIQDNKQNLLGIIDKFGYHHQIKKIVEEQQELVQALELEHDDMTIEEIADNLILLFQFIYKGVEAYPEISQKIAKQIQYKIDRTMTRYGIEVKK